MALLQSWFQEQSSKLNSLSELYERVQWAGNVLPRLCAPSSFALRPSPDLADAPNVLKALALTDLPSLCTLTDSELKHQEDMSASTG